MKISIPLQVSDENIDIMVFHLTRLQKEGQYQWETDNHFYDENHKLVLSDISQDKDIKILVKGIKIIAADNVIKTSFVEAYEHISAEKLEQEADGIEYDETENTPGNSLDKNPYDPKLIRVDTKPFPIAQVEQMISDKELDISPDFQRGFVWNDITRKSRLIESLLLRIPLPVFYVAQDLEGNFQVVDGIQRLNVIHDFLNNGFRLKNMEYLTECEGLWFKNKDKEEKLSLAPVYQRRINQTQLYFNVIDPQTPEQVKYDIFKRINTGGKSLNSQEIRNCLAHAQTRQLLKKMAESKAFLQATRYSISSTRMADKELALRFIAFYLLDNSLSDRMEYKGDMDEFLNATIDILNNLTQETMDRIYAHFCKSMCNAYIIFGQSAFRKASYINKSLFLSFSRILYRYETDYVTQKIRNSEILDNLKKEIEGNDLYNRALSMGTNDARNVEISYNTAKKIIERFL